MNVKKNDNYFRRQVDILSNLGIFYLIIIALFAIPLCAAFVVVLIHGVMDFKYVIIGFGTLAGLIVLILIVRAVKGLMNRIKRDGTAAYQDATHAMYSGNPIRISILNGLISFSYGEIPGNPSMTRQLPGHGKSESMFLLPEQPVPPPNQQNLISQLKELAALRKQGIIDDTEFNRLKQQLLQAIPDIESAEPEFKDKC